ncbi:unnamed protein product [Parnassius mnemosyne]|uniref:Regulatory protein zeste n=1 Tax=Parnassius mnemosyne TaxID=213953 RepID=A0AAV1LLK0_9NEOP
MAPHTGSATPEQIDALLNFLDEHRDLARGRLRSLEGKVQAKRLWDELCNTLNSMGGCTKTVQQWQKVWFDRKHLAKKAAADSRRSASMTGGGPSVAPQLSHSELKVLSIMGDGFGDRQIGARVPAFTETNESRPSTYSLGSQLQQQSLDLHVEVEEYADPSKESQQVYSNSTKNEISIEIDTQDRYLEETYIQNNSPGTHDASQIMVLMHGEGGGGDCWRHVYKKHFNLLVYRLRMVSKIKIIKQ